MAREKLRKRVNADNTKTEELIENTDKLKLSLGDILRHKRKLKIETYNRMIKMRNKLQV